MNYYVIGESLSDAYRSPIDSQSPDRPVTPGEAYRSPERPPTPGGQRPLTPEARPITPGRKSYIEKEIMSDDYETSDKNYESHSEWPGDKTSVKSPQSSPFKKELPILKTSPSRTELMFTDSDNSQDNTMLTSTESFRQMDSWLPASTEKEDEDVRNIAEQVNQKYGGFSSVPASSVPPKKRKLNHKKSVEKSSKKSETSSVKIKEEEETSIFSTSNFSKNFEFPDVSYTDPVESKTTSYTSTNEPNTVKSLKITLSTPVSF